MNVSKRKISETESLKIKIKDWEKSFLTTNGRKPDKKDIEANESLRSDYKKYWKLIERKNMSQVWGKRFNKSVNNTNKYSIADQNSSLRNLSQKMFNKFINETKSETKTSFSLKKKSMQKKSSDLDQNNQTISKLTDKMPENNNNNRNQFLERTKSIDESILRSISNEINFYEKEEQKKISIEPNPILINDIIECVEKSIDDFDETSVSDSLKSDSIESNSLTIIKSMNNKRKSAVFEFDDEVCEPVKKKTSIYKDLNPEENTQTRPQSKQSMVESEDQSETQTTENRKKFFKSKERVNYNFNLIDKQSDDEIDYKPKQTKTENNSNEEKVTKVKQKSETETRDKRSKAKKVVTNYKKLNMKKKVFASRGYRKFNFRKYKRGKWKQCVNEHKNNCYKCGQSGHWAQECNVTDVIDNDAFEDELKEFGVSKNVEDLHQTIQVKPLLSQESSDEFDAIINDGLCLMGHKAFREDQEVIIKRIMSGKSSLFISSTGSGKSLCYQLPAYLYWKHRKAITLVISPLISLMEDQLTTFPKCVNAVCIHSGLNTAQKQSAIDRLLSGEAQVILLSPEAIVGGNTCISFNALPPIAFVCIDEAHCLSEWSNNFRPSYLQLYRILKEKMKIQTFLALTATATKQTSLTIGRTLGLNRETDIIGKTLVTENLILTVSKDGNKDLALIDLLKSERFRTLKSIIIYCTRREETERLASLIRISLQDIRDNTKSGKTRIVWDAKAYHAGLTSDERNRVQKRFIKGDLRVIVATIAFGMGINKADIRAIIHYNLPKSFENYMQEIGRAGRDGETANCHLFLDSDGKDLFELQRHIYANSTDRKCLRKLIEKLFKPCKCRQIFDSDLNESDSTIVNACPGHEIAFPIQSTVLDLDLKEETILTLITYLENDFCKGKVKLLPPINSMCTVLCYGEGSEQMQRIAKQCPPIGIALTLHQRSNSSEEIPGQLKFSLVEVCSMLGKQLSDVRNQLRQLEWESCNGRRKRTNVRVVFSDLSFHLKSVGDLAETELNDILEYLHQFSQNHESTQVSKLRNVYLTFKQYSQSNCTQKVSNSKCHRLKEELNKYFNDIDYEKDLSKDNSNQLNIGTHIQDLEQSRRDIRDLISIHGEQSFGSARVIARILQGIGSPRYPAEVWGKVRRFWRSNISVNFNDLLKIANEELIRLKGI